MENQPVYIVGVDVGLTGTAVSYAEYNSSEWDRELKYKDSGLREMARIIDSWPPMEADKVEHKVPTRIEAKPGEIYRRWGFQCTYQYMAEEDFHHVKRYFKLLLEDGALEGEQSPGDISTDEIIEHVKDWYKKFLENLYLWIKQWLENIYRGRRMSWSHARVEYAFSVPTTWPSRTVDLFKSIVKSAGFGDVPRHHVSISLTEAEATAVYALRYSGEQFTTNDRLIVCDAGGGTTDVTTLELTSENRGVFGMRQLCPVEGDVIGSVQIDEEVEKLIEERLEKIVNKNAEPGHQNSKAPQDGSRVQRDPKAIETFQNIKHQVGEPDFETLPGLSLAGVVKGEPKAQYPEARVFDGKMMVDKDEIHKIFEGKVEGISALINEQLKRVNRVTPGKPVSYLILSGGLGSSTYIYNKLKELYSSSLQVVRAKEPRLAVSKGLVLDRLYRHVYGISMKRCCRASYGILYREPYDRGKHWSQTPTTDPVDKGDYAEGQIKWLIKKNTLIGGVDQEDILHRSTRNLGSKEVELRWNEIIVTDDGEPEHLPTFYQRGSVKEVKVIPCHIKPGLSDLNTGAMRKRKVRFWKIIKVGEYWELRYGIKLTIGAADLGAELWYNKEKKMQQDLEADWDTTYQATRELRESISE